MADRLGVNLDAAISAKLAVLESRYPKEALGTDGSIDAYKALREKARSREALTEAPEMKTLLGFRSFLAETRAGEWAAASDNRIYFVRYARETIDFWRNAEALEKNLAALYSPEEVAEALPWDFPERPDRAQLEALGLPGLILFLGRLARLEHIRDGVILAAADSGVLAAALEVLSRKTGAPAE